VRWLGAFLCALASASCSGRSRPEAGEPAPCTGDRRDLRLWTLNLSHPDTVTLKNTSECAVELDGVELFFDDRDDAFAEGIAVDCTVRLPPLTLEGGASARLSELPYAGEIDAIAHEVSGCAYPLTFNPDRGGVTYLCDGPCDSRSLVDALAHVGDDQYALAANVLNPYRDPPALRFGASFEEPVWGTSFHNDGLVRHQRVATEGRAPSFVGSDWGIQSRILFADFEDGVRARSVQSSPASWSVLPGEAAEIVTTVETAASLATSLRLSHDGNEGASVALAWSLGETSVPRDLAYFARVGSPDVTAANLALGSEAPSSLVELGFEPSGAGATHGEGRRADVPALPDRWYRIELRDIDWSDATFDLYVDGASVDRRLSFASAGPANTVRLGSSSPGSTAYFDALELWSEPYLLGPAERGELAGRMRCGVGMGGDDSPPTPLCDDIDGSLAEPATCDSFCSAWDAICCGELFAENYADRDECLAACSAFTPAELCCRASHGRVGGPERCRYALGVGGTCGD
jgi:hypothetical protein